MVESFAFLSGVSANELLISAGIILFGVFCIVFNMMHINGKPRGVVGGTLFILGVIGYWVVKINHWEQAVGMGLGIALLVVVVLAWGWFKLIGSA